MRKMMAIPALAALLASPAAMPAPAFAHTYHGHNRYYHRKCGSGNGAVGTVAGGVGGALIGNALGGGAIGTIAGAGGGALLGRHFDKRNTRAKNRRDNGC